MCTYRKTHQVPSSHHHTPKARVKVIRKAKEKANPKERVNKLPGKASAKAAGLIRKANQRVSTLKGKESPKATLSYKGDSQISPLQHQPQEHQCQFAATSVTLWDISNPTAANILHCTLRSVRIKRVIHTHDQKYHQLIYDHLEDSVLAPRQCPNCADAECDETNCQSTFDHQDFHDASTFFTATLTPLVINAKLDRPLDRHAHTSNRG